jgi:hypothetical protein
MVMTQPRRPPRPVRRDDAFKVWDTGVLEVATGGGIVIYGPNG